MKVSDFIIQSLQEPRQAARGLLNMNIEPKIAMIGLLLSAVLSAIFSEIFAQISPPPPNAQGVIYLPPFAFAIISAVAALWMSFAMSALGRKFGGQATFADILPVLTWVQLLQVLGLAVVLVVFLILPLAASLANLFFGVFAIYLLCQFVAEAHGFSSGWKSFSIFALSIVGLAVLGAVLFVSLGISAWVTNDV